MTSPDAVRSAVGGGLAVILDDVHWADEPSLLTLRHLADQIASDRLLVFATFRDVEPASLLRRVLPDLLRGPATERVDLRGFGLAEVREQLARTGGGQSGEDARVVLDVTDGNPLFVREVARAMADGTWRPDRPPSTVLDSSMPVSAVDQVGDVGDYQFVHALTRDAVRASLATAERIELHRAVDLATEATFAGDLSEYLGDIARHWAELAPDGEAAAARTWTIRAAEEAVRRLAYEEAVRLYNVALALPVTSGSDSDRCRILVALGRAAHSAGDVSGSVDAAQQASDAALAAGSPELMAEAALVLEAIADPAVNAVAKRLCEQALGGLVDDGSEAMRARLLARQAHLAFYDGDHSPTSAGHDPPR